MNGINYKGLEEQGDIRKERRRKTRRDKRRDEWR